ncbi:MAG: rod shape-determining protein RodA [Bdellovibrionaceae bacterium]|nr:rod shape-determining protein RodA [Pseudobdellovibrionaceae bacterium]
MSTNLKVKERSFFQRLDLNFVFVILALNVIGLINLYSATHSLNVTYNERLFFQQLVWLFGGWFLFFLITLVDYEFWKRFSIFFYFVNIFLLIAVMAFGTSVYGSQRWLDLGFFRLQPSETVKLAVILMMAKHLSEKSAGRGLGYKDLVFPALITGVPFILTVKQPDLGTALLMTFISSSMILFVRIKKSILILVTILTLFATPIAWNFGLKEYQRNRVLTFLSPGRDPRGTGYNSIQSKIAVGSGRILGKGFRKGTQSQLEFIPERHSDFIFSVLSEEHGFIGSVTTLSLFLILFIMSINIASSAKDKFGTLMVVGITSAIFWHMFINIGMVIGLLPIVGVPLPLLSYGGSSMLTTMLGLGLISAVAYRRYLF